ncbi:MAG: PHP domain-containing protein [Clostridia bacterium]|nr:PHP domain-containing protein [Clostridia bacterium]
MKIDLHVHSSDLSLCAHMSAEETIHRYIEAGYDGFVLTNHFTRDMAEHFERHGIPQSDYFAHYKACYEKARAYGAERGFLVLCGYELRFDRSSNDYLVYGMSDEIAEGCLEMFGWGPEKFGQFARENGILFYQAHPFRNHMRVVNPRAFFGMEIVNGNPRHDSRNDIAKAWTEKFGLHQIAGSDCHQSEDVGIAGIEFEGTISTMDELCEILREDRYKIYER